MGEARTSAKQITICSDISKIQSVRQAILAEMSDAGFDEESKMAVAVALDECLTNAIKHGNKNNRKLTVDINYKIAAGRVEISITDQGRGFNWRANKHLSGSEEFTGYEIGGRGLFMINNMMTRVDYNDAGNQVTIVKANSAE